MSPEEQIVLLLVRIEGEREAASDHVRRLARQVDAEALLEVLRRLRLTALVGSRLAAVVPYLGGPIADAAAAERRLWNAVGHSRALIVMGILGALNAASIRAAPFKGITFADEVYGEPGMRISADLDILVNRHDLYRAVEVVQRLGWNAPSDPVDRHGLPLLHFELRGDGLPAVELHWRTHMYERSFVATALDRAQRTREGLRLRPEDHLACVLLAYVRDGLVGLRLPADVAAWWDRYHDALPRPVLTEVWNSSPELRLPLAAAARAASRWTGIDPDALAPMSASPPRAKAAARLANPLIRGEVGRLGADVAVMDPLLAPAPLLSGALRRTLWPSMTHLRHGRPDLIDRSRAAAEVARATQLLRTLRRWAHVPAHLVRGPF